MRHFAKPATLALVGVTALFALGASSDEPTLSDRVLTELEAANLARSALAQEKSHWESERERLLLLQKTLKSDIEKLELERQKSLTQTASITNSLSQFSDLEAQLQDYQSTALAIANQLHNTLDTLALSTPPGAIAPRLPGTPSDNLEALRAALLRLEQSEKECATIRVEIVSAYMDEQERSVKLLRLGAAALWWAALDGSDEGVATLNNGKVELESRKGYEIAHAIEMVEGRRKAAIVELPVEHLEFKEASQ